MARVTVEDCIKQIPNRFDLVMAAAQRVRNVNGGAALSIDRGDDKLPVTVLREIGAGTIDLDDIQEHLIKGHQRVIELPESEDDIVEMMDGEHTWINTAIDAEGNALEAADEIDLEEEDSEVAAEIPADEE